MEPYGLTQWYFLCTVGDRGRMGSWDLEKLVGLTAAAAAELLLDGAAALEDDRLSLCGPLPAAHLAPVYDYVKRKGAVKVRAVVEAFAVSLTSRMPNSLIEAVAGSLEAAGLLQRETGGLLGRSPRYVPVPAARDRAVEALRAELLEEGAVSEEAAAMALLLHKSGQLNRYFSPYERKGLKARLKALRQDPEAGRAVALAKAVEEVIVLAAVAIT